MTAGLIGVGVSLFILPVLAAIPFGLVEGFLLTFFARNYEAGVM